MAFINRSSDKILSDCEDLILLACSEMVDSFITSANVFILDLIKFALI